MIIVDLEQGTPAWHQWRAGGIGASNVASVIQWPYAHESARALWMMKTGRKPPPNLDNNFFVKRGHNQEPLARLAFERWLASNGNSDLVIPVCGQHDSYPFMRVSFDGLMSDGTPVELKVPAWETFELVLKDRRKSEAYLRYLPQVQDQLLVTGAKMGYLAFYRAYDRKLIVFSINRDEEMIELLVERQKWWWDLVERDQAPPITELDYFEPETPESQEVWTQTAAELQQVWRDVSSIKPKVDEAKAQEALLKKTLREMMGSHIKAEYAGVRLTSSLRQGAIDYGQWIAEVKKQNPHIRLPDIELFRKPSSESIRVTPIQYNGDGAAASLSLEFF
ncbi:YqaJ viral recombinase family nuclease [Aeromonas sp. Y311-2]|uniref:YqaJ viral recombinase family nuclease n=1 Tax=Aeromonas sp. Y311-2 TaxID=2990507 RepID=UPI0022E19F71|nr:YqaJ viral recombinase family protein [Aeromonas sp. Y311-2]